MKTIRRLLAIALAALLAGTTVCEGANPAALGVVVEAEHARLGGDAASEGTTVYAGDHLATEDGGSMQVRVGTAMVLLREKSSATVRNGNGSAVAEFVTELESGAAVLSVGAGESGEIIAWEASIRPVSGERGVVEVEVLGKNKLQVTARKGAAEVSYRGESGTIADGKTCLVMLTASDDGGAGGAGGSGTPAAPQRKKALWIIAVAAAALTLATLPRAIGGGSGVESPEKP
ncbi:MAG TPA: hypothetical protein VJN93_11060 [Candidatus Acidoferrum sp.]|nr:hypothetical protein [Candidatus Acidoferrum sp.]